MTIAYLDLCDDEKEIKALEVASGKLNTSREAEYVRS